MAKDEISQEEVSALGKILCKYANAYKLDDFKKFLEEHNIGINARDADGNSVLHHVVSKGYGNKDILNYMVEQGCQIDTKNNEGKTPLYRAVERNSLEYTKSLVEAGADLRVVDNNNTSLIGLAVYNEKMKEYLCQSDPDIGPRDKKGNNLFLSISKCTSKEDVKNMLASGINVNAQDSDGRGLLHYATIMENKEVVEGLIEAGIKVDLKDKDGKTALYCAVEGSNLEISDVLVQAGADVNVTDSFGKKLVSYVREEIEDKDRADFFQVLNRNGNFDFDYKKDLRSHFEVESVKEFDGAYAVASDDGITVYRTETVSDKARAYEGKVNLDIEMQRGNPVVEISALIHEYNHRLHKVDDGMEAIGFSSVENVQLDVCTEAVAHTSMALSLANSYANLKNAGIKEYEYIDRDGVTHQMPIEDLLTMYSKELHDYVVKNGFDPKNQESVDKVAEIGIQWWQERLEKTSYAKEGGQFDAHAELVGDETLYDAVTGVKSKSQAYEDTIDRMVRDVPIADGLTVDLSHFREELSDYPPERALTHVLRKNGVEGISSEQAMEIADVVSNASDRNFSALQNFAKENLNADIDVEDRTDYFNNMMGLAQLGKYDEYSQYVQSFEREKIRQEIAQQVGELPDSVPNVRLADKIDEREQGKERSSGIEKGQNEEQMTIADNRKAPAINPILIQKQMQGR